MRCPVCKNKTKVIKAGIAITRKGKKQRYQCKGCARVFYAKGGK